VLFERMDNDLQFERAEFAAAPATICTACQRPLTNEYFAANGRILCASCAAGLQKVVAGQGSRPRRFLVATVFGLGAAIAGALVYWGVMVFAHSEWAIISIGIGYIVGKAVRKGSGNRGGWRYQLLAAVLTYASIAGAYASAVLHQIGQPTPEQVVAVALAAYRIPFMGGFENLIGILIIAFGVWQAWQLNRPLALAVTGPHAIAADRTIATPPASA
jgi:hypothetical protein